MRGLGRWRWLGTSIAVALMVMGCSPPRHTARPALFMVRDADTVIWLFGAVHVLPANVDWHSAAIDRAMATSDQLVTEIPPVDPGSAPQVYERFARGDRLPPVAERLPLPLRSVYRDAAASAGLDPAALDRLDSWAVATALDLALAKREGADVEHGVEAVVSARMLGKSRLGLESLSGQLALLDGLSAEDQRRLLVQQLSNPGGYRATLAAWSRGDVGALAAIDDRLFAGAPTLEATLLTDRNARWSRWITARMARPGTVFVAVGAGHLAGPGSVIAMLGRRGLKVSRVQ